MKPMHKAKHDSPATTLAQAVGAGDTRIYVNDASDDIFPPAPNLASIFVIDGQSETIVYSSKGPNYLDCTRGVDSVALAWTAGTRIGRMFTSKDLNDLQDNLTETNSPDNILAQIKKVDGSASGLDADFVRGVPATAGFQHAVAYIPIINVNSAMEISHAVDFHSPGSSDDFNSRLECMADGQLWITPKGKPSGKIFHAGNASEITQAVYSSDLNQATATGNYDVNPSSVNTPAAWGMCHTDRIAIGGGIAIYQTFYVPDAAPRMFIRNYTGGRGTWSAWAEK